MTEEEVRAVPVPLPWVTIELLAMWREKAAERAYADDIAAGAELLRTGVVTYHTNEGGDGNVVRWEGCDTFMHFGASQVEVRTGKLLWLPDAGGVWFETSYGPAIPSAIANLPVIARTNRRGYTEMHKGELERANPIVDSVIDLTPEDNSPRGALARLGVRIG